MRFERKVWLCLQKSYMAKGLELTSYAKYLIAFFALASSDVMSTLAIGSIYAILSYFAGRTWYRSGFMEAEVEVGNRFNRFVREMRRKAL